MVSSIYSDNRPSPRANVIRHVTTEVRHAAREAATHEPIHVMHLVTIGVYGFSEEAFFAALQKAGVNTFCDIRWRRGVRGPEYAFVNSARLQKKLNALGIRYLHFRELAPSPALRERQATVDKAQGTPKRKRKVLGAEFI